MRFDTPKSLSSVLEEFLEKFPQKRKLKQGMILSAFADVVGERMADEVEDLHFEGNKLVMKVKHPSWRHEIHTSRFSIAKRLNAKVKGDIVGDIVVRS